MKKQLGIFILVCVIVQTGVAKYKAAALYTAATDKLFLEYDLPDTFFFLSGEDEGNDKATLQNNAKKKQSVVTGISVYPNPAKDVVYFENLQKATHLEITDVTGKVILSTGIANSVYQWKASNVSNGLYFYKIYKNKTQIATGKVVIAK